MNKPLRFLALALALTAAGAGPAARPPWLPDPALTPGTVYTVTAEEVCAPGYAGRARNVSESTKREVFRRYGLARDSAAYEVDHLVPLTLGGSNDLSNLWPQPYAAASGGERIGAAEKDRLESAANRAVCAGKLPLAEAQRQAARDWTVLYRRLVSPTFPPAVGPPRPR